MPADYLTTLVFVVFGLPDGKAAHAAVDPSARLDRAGLRKALIYTFILLILFATPLPHVEGVLLVAGDLLVSRQLASKRILGLVDWHLLVLFGGLFVVTHALETTGLPGEMVARLVEAGLPLGSLSVLGPLTILGSNTIGNVPLVVLLLSLLPSPTPELLYSLALISTLAGNLLIVGSLANIITVERARDVGVKLGFVEHARCGIPITLLSLAIAVGWLRSQ